MGVRGRGKATSGHRETRVVWDWLLALLGRLQPALESEQSEIGGGKIPGVFQYIRA